MNIPIDDLTYEGFCAFVADTADETPVDNTAGWCSCAVADFVCDRLGILKPKSGFDSYSDPYFAPFHEAKDYFLADLEEAAPILYAVLNESVANTYGEIRVAIFAQDNSDNLPF